MQLRAVARRARGERRRRRLRREKEVYIVGSCFGFGCMVV
jgi:hypothetical protein